MDAQFVGPMVDILSDIKGDTNELKQLKLSFLHGITCLGQAINKTSLHSKTPITLKLTSRDEWINICCKWMKGKKKSVKLRTLLLQSLTELVSILPLPSNDLRTTILDVCLPTLTIDSNETDSEMENIVLPLSNMLTSLLKSQSNNCTNQLRMMRSLTFGGGGMDRLSNYVTHNEENVRNRSLHVISNLINTHSNIFVNTESTTLCDMYALIAPRMVDRHLRVQNISTSIINRIVSRSVAITSSSNCTSSSSSLFFSTSIGQSIGNVLERPSSTRERFSALIQLCDYFAPRVPAYKDIRDYIVVFIGSLNDSEPAVAAAAGECILHMIDTRGKEYPELVELLIPTPLNNSNDSGGSGGGGSGGISSASNANSSSDANKEEKKINEKGVKSPKITREQKKKNEDIKKKKIERMIQRPKNFMDAFFAMSNRERKKDKLKEEEGVLRRHSRMLTTFSIRSLTSHHFESSMNALLSSPLPLSPEILDAFVGLVCPPESPRALDEKQLPVSCTSPMLQKVIERCIVILNSAPTGTSKSPNAILSASHQALQSILTAPSSSMTSFINEYYPHLLAGMSLSIGSMSVALGDVQFVADAITTCDILLRRAGKGHICIELEKLHRKITNIDVPSMLASIVTRTTTNDDDDDEAKAQQHQILLRTMSNFYNSNDIGQRRTSIAVVSSIVSIMKDTNGKDTATNETSPSQLTELLLSKAMDNDPGVVRHAVIGLGNVASNWKSHTFEKHSSSIINTTVGLMDNKKAYVADAALSSLKLIVSNALSTTISPLLLNIFFRLYSIISSSNTASTLIYSFQLLSEMCIFNNIHNNNITQFEEQMHRMLPLVIVQLRSSTFDVRVACYDALVQMSILFDSYGANGCSKIVTNNCAVGLRGKRINNYEQFIIELSKLINLSFPQRKFQIF